MCRNGSRRVQACPHSHSVVKVAELTTSLAGMVLHRTLASPPSEDDQRGLATMLTVDRGSATMSTVNRGSATMLTPLNALSQWSTESGDSGATIADAQLVISGADAPLVPSIARNAANNWVLLEDADAPRPPRPPLPRPPRLPRRGADDEQSARSPTPVPASSLRRGCLAFWSLMGAGVPPTAEGEARFERERCCTGVSGRAASLSWLTISVKPGCKSVDVGFCISWNTQRRSSFLNATACVSERVTPTYGMPSLMHTRAARQSIAVMSNTLCGTVRGTANQQNDISESTMDRNQLK